MGQSLAPMVPGIVLAAGASARFAPAHKLLAPYRGRAIVAHTLKAALDSHLNHVVLVTGCRRDEIIAALEDLNHHPKLVLAHNADWQTGRASSLKTGLAWVPDTSPGFLALPADLPCMTTDLMNAVIERFVQVRTLCFPLYNQRKGHPVAFPIAWKARLCALQGDESGLRLIRAHWAEAEKMERTDVGTQLNLNAPDDYERLLQEAV